MWFDIFRMWGLATEPSPVERRERNRDDIEGAGVASPEGIPDIRADGSFTGGSRGLIQLRDSRDFIDLSSVTNRASRYKEYDRLRHVAEIETAMTVFADETCVVGKTPIATPFGFTPIAELAQRKNPEERFLVYCYDFKKHDFTLGWASHPRKTKTARTVKIILDDGSDFSCTLDHRVLLRSAEWKNAGDLTVGDELMPFYRVPADPELTKTRKHLHPRIWTLKDGWKHERHFIQEWRTGEKTPKNEKLYKLLRLCNGPLSDKKIAQLLSRAWPSLKERLMWAGFSYREMKLYAKKYPPRRRVVGTYPDGEQDVYDLSVQDHENFCTDTTVFHNCQIGENGHMFSINVKNQDVKKELEYLFFHPSMLNIDRKLFAWAKNLYIYGDHFLELVMDPENPRDGILNAMPLPPDSMYRIETIKNKLIEFQQSKEGPDYQSLSRVEVTKATPEELAQATAIRFHPKSVVHMRIGDDRRTFYPYGVSLIEPARGPAHQLRLMEDAMLVYRLVRAPERRVFYIDVGNMPPFKAESFMERMKDQLRKRKTFSSRGGAGGNSSVEERWQAPSQDEDFWIPIRPNANTRVETLPGACLSLDTEIPLLDGRTLTLSDIIREFESGKKLWAYSCDPENGAVVPGPITWAGVTRRNTEVLRITLDNGESVVCTPDHKFPVIGKGNIEAKDLLVGESLIPFNTRRERLRKDRRMDYTQVYDSANRKWVFTHRMVANYFVGTSLENQFIYNKEHADEKRNVVHHINFKRFDNSPENLCWMSWDDHKLFHKENMEATKENISVALKKYHKNLSEEERQERNARLVARALTGTKSLGEKLKNADYNKQFTDKQREGWVRAKIDRAELHAERGRKITERNLAFWSDPKNKQDVFRKQTIVYPKPIFEIFRVLIESGKMLVEVLNIINSDKALIQTFVDANSHIKRDIKLEDGLNDWHAKKMAKSYGFSKIGNLRKVVGGKKLIENDTRGRPGRHYPKVVFDAVMKGLRENVSVVDIVSRINNDRELLEILNEEGFKKLTTILVYKMSKAFGYESFSQAKEQARLYNHKVVKIERLEEKRDTGTLTIDGKEEFHKYHNFAIKCGIFTKNSSLGEIDDALYFRNKVFIALNFPKSYMAQEDVSITKMSLSSVDVKFSRLVERLQMSVADGILQIAIRHLELMGFPPHLFEDLQIAMTPPSHHREISENEVIEARFNRAMAIKGSQLFSDLDIMLRILKIPMEEAKEMVARSTIQKLQDLKLQLMSQNPQLMGVVAPGQEGTEMGAEGGGPNPMLSGDEQGMGQQPGMPGQEQGMEGMPGQEQQGQQRSAEDTFGQQTKQQPQPLPDPTDEELKRYDLEILDYSSGIDEEEVDELEVE